MTLARWLIVGSAKEERLEAILGPTSFELGVGEGAVERLPMDEPDDQERLWR